MNSKALKTTNLQIVNFCVSDVDLVTPLCSQVTYEGVLDDTFGITSGKHVAFVKI